MSETGGRDNGGMWLERSSEPLVVALGGNGSAGVPVARSVAHEAPGVLHLAVSVQIVDVSGAGWLLQRRAATKMLFANRWANTCCTHPAPGEDPASTALRRLREETGLVVEGLLAAGSFTYRATDPRTELVEHEHDLVFVALADVGAAEPDPNEISQLALLPFEQAIALLQSDGGAPWAATVLRRSSAALGRNGVARRAGSGTVVGSGAAPPKPDTGPPRKEGKRPMTNTRSAQVTTTDYQRDVANYWDTHTNDPVNLELGKVDDIYHHHYGLGDPDPAVLQAPDDVRDDRITRELHRLETAQADLLLDNLGTIRPEDQVLDGGSGRGGTSIMAHARFGCGVDGVTISEYQVNFANDQAERRGWSEKVQFHLRNMLDTAFADGQFHAIWTNETTMYVDLFELYREFWRLLPRGGRYVCITGCYNDVLGGKSASVRQIDDHYICDVHPRSTYFKALAANDLVPIKVLDLTPQTIPYWELRSQSSVKTGIEEAFLTAYREESFHYLLIVADRA
jgi:geranyl diphosphate 2-C-methyltransferase